jgi:hypothetical protein
VIFSVLPSSEVEEQLLESLLKSDNDYRWLSRPRSVTNYPTKVNFETTVLKVIEVVRDCLVSNRLASYAYTPYLRMKDKNFYFRVVQNTSGTVRYLLGLAKKRMAYRSML